MGNTFNFSDLLGAAKLAKYCIGAFGGVFSALWEPRKERLLMKTRLLEQEGLNKLEINKIKDLINILNENPGIKTIGLPNSGIVITPSKGSMSMTAEEDGKKIEIESDLKFLPTQLQSVLSRLLYTEAKNQENQNKVIGHAFDTLMENQDTVSDEPVDPDWINTFFEHAGNISSEEMQILWGKILAGEIKQPGSFSARTLDVLRKMSKEEAILFNKIAPVCFEASTVNRAFIPNYKDIYIDGKLISYSQIMELEEAGLLTMSLGLSIQWNPSKNEKQIYIYTCGKYVITIQRGTNCPLEQIQVATLTKAGFELLQLMEFSPNEDTLNHIKKFANSIDRENVLISVGIIVKNHGNGTFEIEGEPQEL